MGSGSGIRTTPGATVQAPGSVQMRPESALILVEVCVDASAESELMPSSSRYKSVTGDEGQVLGQHEARGGVAHRVDGAHQAHRGGAHSGAVVVAVLAVVHEVDDHHRLALDLDAVATPTFGGLWPVGHLVHGRPGHVVEDDPGYAGHLAHDLEADRTHGAGRDVHARGAQVDLGGDPLDDLLQVGIELDVEPGCDVPDDRTPGGGEDAWLPQHRDLIHRLAEAVDVAHHDRLVVRRVVRDLADPDEVDALGQAGHRQWQHVV